MITSDIVLLRSLDMNDLDSILTLHNDVKIKKSAMYHPFPVSFILDKEWMESTLTDISNKTVYFGIEEVDSKKVIGFISLTNIDWISRNCNFGIIINSEFQGKGYGKKATEMILNYAFETLNLHKICLQVIRGNERAIKMYEKLGFVKEGELVEQYFSENKYKNVIVMGLFKTDYLANVQ